MLPPAFFTLHRGLPREGPGEAADVHWALDVAGTSETARIFDAACGPGADTVTLAEARRQAQIEAVDITPHFVEEATARTQPFGNRITVETRDYTVLDGKFDLIWCAGAAYFKGFVPLLETWRPYLAPGGAITFSEPVYLTDPPTEVAQAFWAGEGDIHTLPVLQDMLTEAGWRVEGQRLIVGAPWEAYFAPQEVRVQALRSQSPDAELTAVLEEAEQEITSWRAAPDQIAYVLFVVRPA